MALWIPGLPYVPTPPSSGGGGSSSGSGGQARAPPKEEKPVEVVKPTITLGGQEKVVTPKTEVKVSPSRSQGELGYPVLSEREANIYEKVQTLPPIAQMSPNLQSLYLQKIYGITASPQEIQAVQEKQATPGRQPKLSSPVGVK